MLEFNDNFENVDIEKWLKLNNESENGCVFQSPEMYKFWLNQKGYKPFVFSVKSVQGELLAICLTVIQSNGSWPMSALSKRAIIYGGPIFQSHNNRKEIITFLFKNINKKISKKVIFAETRNLSSYGEFDQIYKDNKWNYIPYQNFILKLTTEEEKFKLFTSEKRRQIRRSIKEGVEISYENNKENIEGVYNVIHRIYVEKVKKPLQSLHFFESLCEQNFANVVALKFDNKIIGGAFLLYDEKTVYDWYRGGLDREYKHQFPSTLAAWAVIKYGFENNKESFDFMGAGIKGEDYGVRKFKAQFGGELVEYGRFTIIFKPLLYNLGILGLKILSKIK